MGEPLAWRLKALMDERRITGARELQARLRAAGCEISLPQLGRLLKNPPRRLTLELLAALVGVLDCTAHDLLWRLPPDQAADGPRPPRSRVARIPARSLFDLAVGGRP